MAYHEGQPSTREIQHHRKGLCHLPLDSVVDERDQRVAGARELATVATLKGFIAVVQEWSLEVAKMGCVSPVKGLQVLWKQD